MEQQGLYDPAHEHDACGVGFVVDIKGGRSHAIVRKALQVLMNLLHRGACGCEVNTGDGAGILVQMPDRFLRRECARLGLDPARRPATTGPAWSSCPASRRRPTRSARSCDSIVDEEGQTLLGWRDVPTDDRQLGASARSVEPTIKQVFIGRGPAVRDRGAFERKLYVIRKRVRARDRRSRHPRADVLLRAEPVVATRSSTRAC